MRTSLPQPYRIAPKHRSDSIRNQSYKTLPHQNATPNLLHPTRQTHTFSLTTNAHPSSPPPRHPAHHSLPCRTIDLAPYTALAQRADDMQSSSPTALAPAPDSSTLARKPDYAHEICRCTFPKNWTFAFAAVEQTKAFLSRFFLQGFKSSTTRTTIRKGKLYPLTTTHHPQHPPPPPSIIPPSNPHPHPLNPRIQSTLPSPLPSPKPAPK